MERVGAGLLASGILALVFLAGQLLAWRQLDAAGYYLTANPAAAFFFLITGLHGLHLLGGLGALGRTIDRTRRCVPMRELRLSVELCALYWHFLLLVWLIFFGLLLLGDGSASTSSLVSMICRVF